MDESSNYISCTRPTAKQLWKPSVGVLELGIHGANNLLPMKTTKDNSGSTDAYCVAKYGPKWIRTRTIFESFNPRWNEQYAWEVYDPCTVVTVGVFDSRWVYGTICKYDPFATLVSKIEDLSSLWPRLLTSSWWSGMSVWIKWLEWCSHAHSFPGDKMVTAKDLPVGKVRIRLSTLESDRVYTNSYPLLVVTPQGVKKMGELELAVRFSCASTLNLMHAYFQSQLPRMHFFYPLDPKHSETLRVAAMNIVALKLMRSEPPLRQEVVQFMLDTEAERWSMRRSKANYYRIMVYMPIYNLLQFKSSLFRLSCPWQPCQIFIRSISLLYGSYGLILSKNFHHPLIALLICISFTHDLPLWTPVKAYGAGLFWSFWFIWS